MAVLTNTMMQGTAADSGDDDYKIAYSLRHANNQQLKTYNPHRNTGWKGNTRTFTYATWFKRTKEDDEHILLGNYYDGNNFGYIKFNGAASGSSKGNELVIDNKIGGTWKSSGAHWTKAQFRDAGAWMHIVVVYDATRSDVKERHRYYVNGVKVPTGGGTITWLGEDEGFLNNTYEHRFGGNHNNAGYSDGYFADTFFIDGLALHPGCWGKFNDDGIWTPKKFELPQPNQNTTWSGMVSGTVMSGRAKTRMFDGSAMNQTNGDETTLTFTPTGGLKADSEIAVRMIIDGTPIFKVNGEDRRPEAKGVLGNNTTGWYVLPTRELTTLEWSETGGNECAIYGIKVDGQILQDGRTDKSYADKLKSAGHWEKCEQGSHYNGFPLEMAMQGNLHEDGGVSWMAVDDGYSYFRPFGGITSSSTIRMFVGQYSAFNDGAVYLQHEGVDLTSTVNSAVGSGNWGWVDLPTVGGENKITQDVGIRIYRKGSNGNCLRVKGIEVDGELLYIGNKTSCHFDYNKLTNVGYNNFADDMDTYRDGVARSAADGTDRIASKKTGAAPFWNTSSLGFGGDGNGARPDSFAGTTDGAGLILACPGPWYQNTNPSGTDQHALLNTGSGQKTSAHVGMTDSNGGPSGYKYGYFSHDVDEITFGTTDTGDFDFGTGDFCIEGWWCVHTPDPSTAGWVGLIHGRNSSGWGINVGTGSNGNKFRAYGGASGNLILESPDGLHDGNWHHIAVTRSGTTCRMFINGWIVDQATNNENWNADEDIHLGAGWPSGMTELIGGYQDVRVYKGVAKYTENFDIPRRMHHHASGYTLDMSAGYYHTWDISVDSPTAYEPATGSDGTGGVTRGNYPTLQNKWMRDPDCTVHEGGGRVNGDGSNHAAVAATMHLPRSGKWYWEMRRGTGSNHPMIGIKSSVLSEGTIVNSNTGNPSFFIRGNEARYMDGTEYSGGLMAGFTQTVYQMIGIAVDMDNGAVYARKPDGTWQNSGDPTSGASKTGSIFTTVISDLGDEHYWIPCMKVYDGASHVINFGQVPFQLGSGAPEGYKCLCSTNLPDESITKPTDHFNVKLWTGNSVDDRDIKGYDFQPDMVWIKSRAAGVHAVFDAIRGTTLIDPGTWDMHETSYGDPPAGGYIGQFNSDGFRLKTGSTNSTYTHELDTKYTSWAWDAGTTAITPSTSYDIDPSGQWVNQTAGFSITKYTGIGQGGSGATKTIPHALGAKPQFVWTKKLSGTGSHVVGHTGLGAGKTQSLNNNGAEWTSNNGYINNSAWDNNTITFTSGSDNGDNMNTSGETYIMYSWTGIPGYSKFGSYTGTGGNGSSVDHFVFTGFRPAFLIIKANTGANTQWMLVDNKRDTSNPNMIMSWADDSAAEENHENNELCLLTNGFALTSNTYQNYCNTNGVVFIYCAWAEHPFKTARAY